LCLLVDVALLVAGTVSEPYYLALDGHCALQDWVAYSLLVTTKVLFWFAAIYNTFKTAGIPAHFTDSRLHVVLIFCAVLAIIRLGLQFSDALANDIGIQLFLGSLFMWIAVFLVCCHFFFKLRYGYVTAIRVRSMSKGSKSKSISMPLAAPLPTLRERLEDLLIEIEAQSTKLLADKSMASEFVKANRRLMFEIRAELLMINTQAHLLDDDLQIFLPSSITTALDKFGPALDRRRSAAYPPSRVRTYRKSEVEALEAKQLLSFTDTPRTTLHCISASSDLPDVLPRPRVDSDLKEPHFSANGDPCLNEDETSDIPDNTPLHSVGH